MAKKPTYEELEKRVKELKKETGKNKKAEEVMQQQAHALGERAKELNCLYSISSLMEEPGISFDEIFQGVINLVPPAWQYPEITCSRILLNRKEYKTKSFKETNWKQASDIITHGKRIGILEICYLEEKPKIDEGPFLKEERSLIHTITERLGRIIERIQTKEALRESEEKYRPMMEAMVEPSYICTSDFHVSYMNPAMIKRTGHDATGELCHKALNDLNERCPWCVQDTVQKGESLETKIVSPKDGRSFLISNSPIFHQDGSISKMTIYRDITEHKLAEEALRESEKRYRLLTENVAEGVGIIQNRKFAFINASFTSILGYTIDQLAKTDPSALINDGHKGRFNVLFETIGKDIPVKNFQAPFVHNDGQEIWIEWNHNIIEWEGESAFLFTLRDINERKLRHIAIVEEKGRLNNENIRLRTSIKERFRFGDIIGKSPVMQEVYELTLKAALTEANVFIFGESGTGKELIAKAIHDMSNQADKNFVPVNCGAIPENLIESEFFGHVKGAFTGAHIHKTGYLNIANGGTLFLDELGELDIKLQGKLLRAFDSGEYMPVGKSRFEKARFRIISATNRDISEMLNQGLMREDFYYRLNVIPIELPLLRERKEDIPLLVEHFLKQYGNGRNRIIPGKVMDILLNYDWPGNVRELQNTIQMYLAIGRIDILENRNRVEKSIEGIDRKHGLKVAVVDFEKKHILRTLNQNHWNRNKTATDLKIDVKTLFTKMKKTGLMRLQSG